MQNINDRMAESIDNFQKTGGPAFPAEWSLPSGSMSCPGMTLRDWFAGQIAGGMAAFSGTAGVSYGPREIAGRSYEVADAMLAEREKGGGV